MGIQLLDKKSGEVVEVASETQTLKNASGCFLLYVLFGGLYIAGNWFSTKTDTQPRLNPVYLGRGRVFWPFKREPRRIQYSGGEDGKK